MTRTRLAIALLLASTAAGAADLSEADAADGLREYVARHSSPPLSPACVSIRSLGVKNGGHTFDVAGECIGTKARSLGRWRVGVVDGALFRLNALGKYVRAAEADIRALAAVAKPTPPPAAPSVPPSPTFDSAPAPGSGLGAVLTIMIGLLVIWVGSKRIRWAFDSPVREGSPAADGRGKGEFVGRRLIIDYADAGGEMTRREIRVKSLDRTYVQAFCMLRREERTFRISRIQAAIDAETGEVLEKIGQAPRAPVLMSNTFKVARVEHLPDRYVVVDLETTGLSPGKNEIVEIGAILVDNVLARHETFQAFVKPTRKVPKRITNLTGITQEMVYAEGRSLNEALKAFADFASGHRLVAFNAQFDVSFLHAAADAIGMPRISNEVSCALNMSRRAWPGRRSYKLSALAKDANLSDAETHRAVADCERTVAIYCAAAKLLRSAS